MKTKLLLLPFIALLVGAAGVVKAANETIGGPKGGRLLEATPWRVEFFVTPERKAEFVFYDAALKPVPPASQVVTMIAEPRSGRVAIELERTATGFVSKEPLPESDGPYRVVVQIRAAPEGRPQNFRIDLDLEECGACQRSEYACTCGH